MRLTDENINYWLSSLDTYGQGDGQWIPTREAFEQLCKQSLSSRDEALEEEVCERVKFIGVKSGVAPEVYGAMCFAIREALRSPELNAAPQKDGHSERMPQRDGPADTLRACGNPPVGAAPDRSPGGGADGMPDEPAFIALANKIVGNGHPGALTKQEQEWLSYTNSLRQWALRRPAPPAWVSVEERLPENDDDVLIYHNLGDVERPEVPHAFDVAAYINGEWIFPWDRDMRNNPPRWVQFWMPLPASPEAGGRG